MLKKFQTLVAFLCISLSCLIASAEPLSLTEILESTCRVRAGNSAGTGTIVAVDNSTTYILTNAHVVGNQKVATVEFFGGGYQRKPLKGVVSFARRVPRTDIDFAIISVPNTYFPQDHPPKVIQLAPEDYKIKAGDYIVSAGCPAGRWPSAWEGHVLQKNTSRILFTPPPIGGQSGSGIFVLVPDEKGELYTRLGAVLTWRIGQGSEINPGNQLVGGAIPVSTLYAVLRGESATPNRIPDYYVEVADRVEGVCEHCDRPKEQHALGADGNLYCIKINAAGNMTVEAPPGVQIVQWPSITDVTNRNRSGGTKPSPIIPPRDKTPIPKPKGGDEEYKDPIIKNPGAPPIGAPWPKSGDGKNQPKPVPIPIQPKPDLVPIPQIDDKLSKENDALKNENIGLLKRIKELELQIVDLDKLIKELKEREQAGVIEITGLRKEVEKLNAELAAGGIISQAEIEKKQAEINGLNELIKEKEKVVNQLSINLQAKLTELNQITIRINEIKQQNSEILKKNEELSKDAAGVDNIKNQRDIFGGTTLLGALGVLSTWLYSLYKKRKNGGEQAGTQPQVVTPIPTQPQVPIEPDVGQKINSAVNKVEQTLVQMLEKHQAATNKQLSELQKQTQQQSVSQQPEDIGTRRPPGVVYQEPRYITRGYPAPDLPHGLPPVPPNYPAYQYSVHDVLSAVDEVAQRHSADPTLRSVPVLVRQILESPSRPRKP